MKNLLKLSLVPMLISMPSFADGMKGAAKPKHVPIKHDEYSYVGAGIGWFEGAKAFGADASHIKSKPRSNSPAWNIMVGHKFDPYFRTDINGQYRKLKYKSTKADTDSSLTQKIKSYSLFMNAYIDMPNTTALTPYVTGGLGYAYNDTGNLARRSGKSSGSNANNPGIKTHNLAWNVGGGTTFKMTDNMDLDLSYRYLSLGKIKTKQATTYNVISIIPGSSKDLRLHQVMLNLIYKF